MLIGVIPEIWELFVTLTMLTNKIPLNSLGLYIQLLTWLLHLDVYKAYETQ
jgi:hypothetical protein